jgi:hypothetical protein
MNLKSKGLICLFRGLEKQARKGRSEGRGRWRLRVLELSDGFLQNQMDDGESLAMPRHVSSEADSRAHGALITIVLDTRYMALSLSTDL